MADFTEIIQEINTNLPDNNTQSITAAKLRTTLVDMIDAIDDVQEEFEGNIDNTLSNFVVDNLNSTDTAKALSANQGYNLAGTRDKLIVEGANETLIRQSRIPIQPGHKYKLTLSSTELTMNNISLGSGYSRLYVFASDGRTAESGTHTTTFVNVSVNSELNKEYEFTIPEDGEYTYRWLEIQSRFDAGQTLVYWIDDVTTIEEVEDKISPKIITISKKEIANNYEMVYSNKFPLCKYNSTNLGLFKNYAIGKNWETLLESGTNSNHRTYKIPVDSEKYVMVSCQFFGSSTSISDAPLACLVDENDIVVACITNNLGNGSYWTGNIIPKNAKYLIMPYWTISNYIQNIAFIPKNSYISQNEEKTYTTLGKCLYL